MLYDLCASLLSPSQLYSLSICLGNLFTVLRDGMCTCEMNETGWSSPTSVCVSIFFPVVLSMVAHSRFQVSTL